MLMRSDPFRQFDRVADELFGGARRPWMPLDAFRQADRVMVHFDLPGVNPDSIDLHVERNNLTVTAERQWDPGEGVTVIAAERPHGRVSRQLFLGEELDMDRIEANYSNGVLTLTIPVAEKAKPRRIKVAGSDSTEIAASSRPSEQTQEGDRAKQSV